MGQSEDCSANRDNTTVNTLQYSTVQYCTEVSIVQWWDTSSGGGTHGQLHGGGGGPTVHSGHGVLQWFTITQCDQGRAPPTQGETGLSTGGGGRRRGRSSHPRQERT